MENCIREGGQKDEDVCKSAAAALTQEYLDAAHNPNAKSEKPFSAKQAEEEIVSLLKDAALPWDTGRLFDSELFHRKD